MDLKKFFATSNTLRYAVESPVIKRLLQPIPTPVGRLLDCGCATGYYIDTIYRHIGKEVVGLEYDVNLFERLEKSVAKKRANVKAVQGSILELPFENGQFDAVTCTQVIEHVEDDRRAASELSRVATLSSFLLVSVPHPPAPWEEPGHCREGYSKDQLERLFSPYGWTLLDLEYYLCSYVQRLVRLTRKSRLPLPLVPLAKKEAKLSREQKLADSPYGLACLFVRQ